MGTYRHTKSAAKETLPHRPETIDTAPPEQSMEALKDRAPLVRGKAQAEPGPFLKTDN
jgi:hypothetical protein